MSLNDLLEKNRAWAASLVAQDPDYFARLAGGQHPRLLWIGCSDSRVPAEEVVGCGPGDLFVHRNVANIVAYNDVNIAAVLQFAVEYLKIEDIVVCGHYGCGGVKAACQDKVIGGYIGDWLMIAAWARRRVDERIARQEIPAPASPEEFLHLVVEKNVRLQIGHLSRHSILRSQWELTPGVPRLHGWVYDIRTGLIKVVVEAQEKPAEILAGAH